MLLFNIEKGRERLVAITKVKPNNCLLHWPVTHDLAREKATLETGKKLKGGCKVIIGTKRNPDPNVVSFSLPYSHMSFFFFLPKVKSFA